MKCYVVPQVPLNGYHVYLGNRGAYGQVVFMKPGMRYYSIWARDGTAIHHSFNIEKLYQALESIRDAATKFVLGGPRLPSRVNNSDALYPPDPRRTKSEFGGLDQLTTSQAKQTPARLAHSGTICSYHQRGTRKLFSVGGVHNPIISTGDPSVLSGEVEILLRTARRCCVLVPTTWVGLGYVSASLPPPYFLACDLYGGGAHVNL